MSNYHTYIFDLDGTLLDTLRDLAESTNYALRQYGMPEHTLDDVRRFVGNGVRRLMERAVPEGGQNPLFEEVFATILAKSRSSTLIPSVICFTIAESVTMTHSSLRQA